MKKETGKEWGNKIIKNNRQRWKKTGMKIKQIKNLQLRIQK